MAAKKKAKKKARKAAKAAPQYRLTPEERAKADVVADGLLRAFDWQLSKKGHDYWYAVFEALINVANDTEKT